MDELSIYNLDACQTLNDALDVLSRTFIEQGSITQAYNQAILDNIRDNGAYFVLAPNIALIHANASHLVNEVSLSFGHRLNPLFIADKPVTVFIYLASPNASEHMEWLMKLMVIMDTEEKQKILTSSSFETYEQLIREALQNS